MNHTASKILLWTPRVLLLCYAGFLSIFAMDVFDEYHGFWMTTWALTMHLLPVFFLLAVLAAAWKREWVGGICYMALFFLYTWWALPKHWDWVAIIGGPLLLIAALYWMNWVRRCHARVAH